MSHDPRTTERDLADALTGALQTTPLDKVTVSGLAATAGVTRQTFYAHFADVYDLAAWTFRQEVADHIMSNASYDGWADGMLELMRYMRDHRDVVGAVLGSLQLAETERFLFRHLRQMMSTVLAEVQGDLVVATSDREFVIDHFTLIALGHLLHWLAGGMSADPFRLVSNLEFAIHGTALETLKRFAAAR